MSKPTDAQSDPTLTQKLRATLWGVLDNTQSACVGHEGSYLKESAEYQIDQAISAIQGIVEEAYRHGYNDNARDCFCGGSSIPHKHLIDDGKSYEIKPDLRKTPNE